ncbi:MAG TPA: vanadium-dependent haloperoxidase, partial [candidate division Zixibacteria bacterium]|nr:vanadium-dependent haloperoxidase [candidate division Zixibacteria bacterium]
RAWFLGKRVGELAVDYGRTDGSDAVFTGQIPTGDCKWTGTNPVLPMCGTWKTWIISSGSEIQPPSPYSCGSAEDSADLEEVYQVALSRTPEQAEIVHKWADLPPPTIWNDYLNRRLIGQRWDALRSARAQAYLNVTMYDAFVCCWKTKYDFWTARPFMRLGGRTPAFTTVITTPNFPSYTSGHSTISAAAAEVMKELFPEERNYFQAEAEEAALSRLWGGIHYRLDNEVGLSIGEQVGAQAVQRMQADGTFPLRARN